MKKILVLVLGMLLASSLAQAEYSPGFLMDPPAQVLAHIERSFSGYTLEDYCEICDTPDGDYGFAMLTAGDERVLVGYVEKNGKMSYWLKNHGALMQGSEEAWFSVSEKGKEYIDLETNQMLVSDGLSFSVTQMDDVGESYEKYIGYHWEDGGFKLSGYKDWDHFYGNVEVEDGVLHFANWLEGWDFGKAYGTVQRDIRYVNFDALPKTIEEAREKLSHAPKLEHNVLYSVPNIFVQEIQFTGGRKYPVYQGPGESYGRAANGKASVSTNDWIQVFCRYQGYAMIQYDISAERYRIGWIEERALPSGAKVPDLNLVFIDDYGNVIDKCILTDDPFNSETPIATLKPGTPICEIVYNMGGWSYIRVTIDGVDVCGFVRSDCISHG